MLSRADISVIAAMAVKSPLLRRAAMLIDSTKTSGDDRIRMEM
jgi:hypothetical protein